MTVLDSSNIIALLDSISLLSDISKNYIEKDMIRTKSLIIDLLAMKHTEVPTEDYTKEIQDTIKNWKSIPKTNNKSPEILKNIIKRVEKLALLQITKDTSKDTSIDVDACNFSNSLDFYCDDEESNNCSIEEKLKNYCIAMRSGYDIHKSDTSIKLDQDSFCDICDKMVVGCLRRTTPSGESTICQSSNPTTDITCGMGRLIDISKDGSKPLVITNVGHSNITISGGQTFSKNYPIFAQYINWAGATTDWTRQINNSDESLQQYWYHQKIKTERSGEKSRSEVQILVNCKFFMHALAFDKTSKTIVMRPQYEYTGESDNIISQEASYNFIDVVPAYLVDPDLGGTYGEDIYKDMYVFGFKDSPNYKKNPDNTDFIDSNGNKVISFWNKLFVGLDPTNQTKLVTSRRASIYNCWYIRPPSGNTPLNYRIKRWDPVYTRHFGFIMLYGPYDITKVSNGSDKLNIGQKNGLISYKLRSDCSMIHENNAGVKTTEKLNFIRYDTDGFNKAIVGNSSYIEGKYYDGYVLNNTNTSGINYGQYSTGNMTLYNSYITRMSYGVDTVHVIDAREKSDGDSMKASSFTTPYSDEANIYTLGVRATNNIIVIKPDNTFYICSGRNGTFFSIKKVGTTTKSGKKNDFQWKGTLQYNLGGFPSDIASFWLTTDTRNIPEVIP